MIQRYTKDMIGFIAWIDGLNDAVEFLDDQLYRADEVASWKDLQSIITELSTQIAFAYQERLENVDLPRSVIPLPTRSSQEDSLPEENFVSGSTWARENFGSLEQLRASGSIQRERLTRHADTDSRCECSHCLDRYYSAVRDTEVPEPKSSGPIIRQRREQEQGSIFGPRRRWFTSNNRRS